MRLFFEMDKKNYFNIFIIAIMIVFLGLCLSACSQKESGPRTVLHNGTTYTIDQEAGTISDGDNVYHYVVKGDGSSVRYEITYPNGSRYYMNWTNHAGYGGWSGDYDDTKYVDGSTLIDVLKAEMPRDLEPKNVPMILLLLVIGVFNTAAPQAAWYLSDGWRFKNAEPSEMALGMTRFGGIIAIIIAVIMMLV